MSATDETEEIYQAASKVFRDLWDGGPSTRQVGIHISKAWAKGYRKYNLFDLQRYNRLGVLNRTIYEIRGKYREDGVMRTSFLTGNAGHMGGELDKERRSGVTIGIDVEGESVQIM